MKKSEIQQIRFTQIITDPFPEHSDWERKSRLFKSVHESPEEISIWRAYKIGYDKAYSEILERCQDD
jgi:hypothetical protein